MEDATQPHKRDRRVRISRRSKLAEPEMYALGAVRKSRAVTQVELAERLEVAQATVSKFEKGNPAVSTLRRYVVALGGQLQLVAVFDDDRMVLDCGLGRPAGARRAARGSS